MMIFVGLLAGLVFLVMMVAYLFISSQNRLVALDQRCQTAFSDIDAHLKHRHNLIPAWPRR